MWNSDWGIDFKASLGRRIKTNPGAMRPCRCNPVMCKTFIGVSSDQWKNGAAAVGTHTLTSLDISSSQPVSLNTFFSKLWWQMLFIAHFGCVITELYLSLYPYLQSRVIKPAPISRLYQWTNVTLAFKDCQPLTVWQTKHIIEYIIDKEWTGKALWSWWGEVKNRQM